MLATRNESLDANKAKGQAKMVEPAEYEKLLIGYGKLERFFDTDHDAYGLRDCQTGTEFMVSAVALHRWQIAR